MAYSFLQYYKKKWLLQPKNQHLAKANISLNNFRFICGLCTFSNYEFENIYLDELQNKKLESHKGRRKFL